MKTYSPYTTAAFKSNVIVMPAPPEPMEPPPAIGLIAGLLYASPVIVGFWLIVYFGIRAI